MGAKVVQIGRNTKKNSIFLCISALTTPTKMQGILLFIGICAW